VALLDTVDDLSVRALNLKLTKKRYIDCLRDVTAKKVLALKKAKDLFEAAIDRLAAAQEYELKSKQAQAERTARQVYLQKGQEALRLFNAEVTALTTEYQSLHSLIRHYRSTLATQTDKLAVQECVIMKLQTHVAVSLRERADERILQQQLAQRQSERLDAQRRPGDPDGEWTGSRLSRHQFDFYGMNIRLQDSDAERVKEGLVCRAKDEEIRGLKQELEALKNERDQQFLLLEREMATASRLAAELRTARREIRDLAASQQEQEAARERRFAHERADLQTKIMKLQTQMNKFRKYNELELAIKDATIQKKDLLITKFRANTKKMRAILRVPRLSRLFHEGLREERLPEYEVLEQVYDAHYELAEEWLPADRYESQEERASFVGTKDGVARLDAARKLSLVEQHIVERNKGSPTRFDAAGVTSSLDFHTAMSKQGYLRQAHQRLMTQALDLRPRNHDKYGKDAPQSSTDPVGAEFRSIQHRRLGAGDGSLNGSQGTFQRYKIKFADNNIKISWKGKKSRNRKMKGAATGPGEYPEAGLPSRLYNTAQKTKGAAARGLNLWQSLDRTNYGTSLR